MSKQFFARKLFVDAFVRALMTEWMADCVASTDEEKDEEASFGSSPTSTICRCRRASLFVRTRTRIWRREREKEKEKKIEVRSHLSSC
jgi:hypothetical protein